MQRHVQYCPVAFAADLVGDRGLVEATPVAGGRGHQYRLTQAGAELEPILLAMGQWAVRWVVGEPRPEELDPGFLMWWLHRRVNFSALPDRRTVVRFDVVSDTRDVFWLVLQPDEASLCVKDPGFEVDLYVVADSMAFHRVFAGRITLDHALHDGAITISGSPALVRQFGSWFQWSPFYESTRAFLEEERPSVGNEPAVAIVEVAR